MLHQTDSRLASTFACRVTLSENAPILKLYAPVAPRRLPSLNSLPRGATMNKRKPDLLWILAFIFGLGVVTTGYAQGLWERKLDAAYQAPAVSAQQQR